MHVLWNVKRNELDGNPGLASTCCEHRTLQAFQCAVCGVWYVMTCEYSTVKFFDLAWLIVLKLGSRMGWRVVGMGEFWALYQIRAKRM